MRTTPSFRPVVGPSPGSSTDYARPRAVYSCIACADAERSAVKTAIAVDPDVAFRETIEAIHAWPELFIGVRREAT